MLHTHTHERTTFSYYPPFAHCHSACALTRAASLHLPLAPGTHAHKHTFTRSNIGRQSEFLSHLICIAWFDCWSVHALRHTAPIPTQRATLSLLLSFSIRAPLASSVERRASLLSRACASVARCCSRLPFTLETTFPSLLHLRTKGLWEKEKKRNVLSVLEYCNVSPAPDRTRRPRSRELPPWTESKMADESKSRRNEKRHGTGPKRDQRTTRPRKVTIRKKLGLVHSRSRDRDRVLHARCTLCTCSRGSNFSQFLFLVRRHPVPCPRVLANGSWTSGLITISTFSTKWTVSLS